jgi:hypothetical protein
MINTKKIQSLNNTISNLKGNVIADNISTSRPYLSNSKNNNIIINGYSHEFIDGQNKVFYFQEKIKLNTKDSFYNFIIEYPVTISPLEFREFSLIIGTDLVIWVESITPNSISGTFPYKITIDFK